MEVRFVDKDAFSVVGYGVETDPDMKSINLPALWRKHEAALFYLPESRRGIYGVLWHADRQKSFYMLGVSCPDENLFDGAAHVDIPAARYAVAEVPDDTTEVEARHSLLEVTLPALGFVPDDEHGKYLELYREDYCELWIPVKQPK